MNQASAEVFLTRKNVSIAVKTYLVSAPGATVFGLLASLFIGTIFATLGEKIDITLFITATGYAKGTAGAALGTSIAYALKVPQLVLFPVITINIIGDALGGPVDALVTTIVGTELDKIVPKETRIDILVTPGVTIISGMLVAQSAGPGASAFITVFGNLVKSAAETQLFFMGILVSALIGITLAPPINNATICIMLSLDELAGGTATASCCAQMTSLAALGFRENGIGDLLVQDLGTSILQMSNIVRDPRIWIPPALASMITGPIATMVSKLQNIPADPDMGTYSLVGPIDVYTAMGGGTGVWIGIPLICFVLPIVLACGLGIVFRRVSWIEDSDSKLGL